MTTTHQQEAPMPQLTYRSIVERAHTIIVRAPRGDMATSADVCLGDAVTLLGAGRDRLAARRAVDAVRYAVGSFDLGYIELAAICDRLDRADGDQQPARRAS